MKILCIISVILHVIMGQSGYEIAKMVDERNKPKDQSSKTTMILTNSKGRTRTSTIYSKTLNGGEKQILWFIAPADDKGVAFLKIEHEGKDDEMRMWLPAFKKIRRITAKKRGDSFMGSDLSYEDMSNRDLEENEYKRLEDEMVDSLACYVLEVIPKKEVKSSYSKHKSWIHKKTLSAVKEESYDKKGKLKKVKSFQSKRMGDYYILSSVFVKDVQKEHTTKVVFEDLKVDTGIEDKLFQEKNLKRLPPQ